MTGVIDRYAVLEEHLHCAGPSPALLRAVLLIHAATADNSAFDPSSQGDNERIGGKRGGGAGGARVRPRPALWALWLPRTISDFVRAVRRGQCRRRRWPPRICSSLRR